MIGNNWGHTDPKNRGCLKFRRPQFCRLVGILRPIRTRKSQFNWEIHPIITGNKKPVPNGTGKLPNHSKRNLIRNELVREVIL